MNWHTLAILSFLLTAFSSAYAEEQVISVPGEGWRIRFDAPKLSPATGSVPSLFFGSADRLKLSFLVEPPLCAGGDTDDNLYACWSQILRQNPHIAWDTLRSSTAPNGVRVMYISHAVPGSPFSMHLYFAHNGKWADLHTSISSAQNEDVKTLLAILDSVVIEEEPHHTLSKRQEHLLTSPHALNIAKLY